MTLIFESASQFQIFHLQEIALLIRKSEERINGTSAKQLNPEMM